MNVTNHARENDLETDLLDMITRMIKKLGFAKILIKMWNNIL